jgi:hypothetical protein
MTYTLLLTFALNFMHYAHLHNFKARFTSFELIIFGRGQHRKEDSLPAWLLGNPIIDAFAK